MMRLRPLAAAIAAVLAATAAHAQIATDGTLGAATTLAGPNFAIPAALGRQAGANLFHSFATFGVPTGGSATFSGPASVANIISRVTGGSASSIDGTLRSTIDGANLFLINPSGIVFGRNASLDLTGSFHASTANYLRFADGTRFDATATAPVSLSIAAPEAFGFLGPGAGTITVRGASLEVASGKSLSFVGGDVRLEEDRYDVRDPSLRGSTRAALTARGGDLFIASVAGRGEASIGALDITPGAPRGEIRLEAPELYAEGSSEVAAGRVVIRGGRIQGDPYLSSANRAATAAGDVVIEATGDVDLDGLIVAETRRAGAGASIGITAGGSATLLGSVYTNTTRTGQAGSVRIVAGALRVGAAAQVGADTDGDGPAGNVEVTARDLTIAGGIRTSTYGAEAAGRVTVRADTLTLAPGATIGSAGDYGGNAGEVDVRVNGHAVIGGRIHNTIYGDGSGAPLKVAADTLQVLATGRIESANEGTGAGGPVRLDANALRMDSGARIASTAADSGPAGAIEVRAATLELAANAVIESRAAYGDTAGAIDLAAARITLDGATVRSYTDGDGAGGVVRLSGARVVLRNGALVEQWQTNAPSATEPAVRIAASESVGIESGAMVQTVLLGAGNGGDMVIEAPRIALDAATLRTIGVRGTAGTITLNGDVTQASGALVREDARGRVVTDGTMGPALALDGPDYDIAASLGTTLGGNLFHSFAAFTLVPGEAATFDAPAGVANVLARVTGEAASVQGTLGTSGPASLWLAAPRGIQFGRGASAALEGGLALTTADAIVLAQGGRFDTRQPAADQLTDGAPIALAFRAAPAPISLDAGAALATGAGAAMLIAGGDVRLTDARLAIDGGSLRIVGVGGAGELPVAGDAPAPALPLGDVALTDARIATGGDDTRAPGSVGVHGRDVTVRGLRLRSENYSADAAGAIDFSATRTLDLGSSLDNGVRIAASAEGDGAGATITFKAGEALRLDGDVGVNSYVYGAGRGGDIRLAAPAIEIGSDVSMYSSTYGGAGGGFALEGDRIALRGALTADTESDAPAGGLRIRAGTLDMDGGRLETVTYASGAAGDVDISVRGALVLRNDASIASQGGDGSGATGVVNVRADTIRIEGDSYVSVTTFVDGPGGGIRLAAREVSVDASAVSGQTNGPRDGGAIAIEAARIALTGGAQIVTFAYQDATGNAGPVALNATESIVIAGRGEDGTASGIVSRNFGAVGRGGDVSLAAPQIRIDSGYVVAAAAGAGRGGDVGVRGGALTMTNGARIDASVSGSGRGGAVDVAMGDAISLAGRDPEGRAAAILSRTEGKGAGGAIALAAPTVALEGGAIVSASTGADGVGGSVTLTGQRIAIGGGATVAANSTGTGAAGRIDVRTDRLSLAEGGLIDARTASPAGGAAGSIAISAREGVRIDGAASGVNAETAGEGQGGGIRIDTPSLAMNGGLIQSSTLGRGRAGDVEIVAGTLQLAAGARVDASARAGSSGDGGDVRMQATDAIVASGAGTAIATSTAGSGAGGEVTLVASTIALRDGASVAASSTGAGAGGAITLAAQQVDISGGASVAATSSGSGAAGRIDVRAVDALYLFGGAITTDAAAADGGNIDIRAGRIIHLRGGEISTSVAGGAGAGGNIFIDPTFVILQDGSRISANAFGGAGGNITLIADYFFSAVDSLVQASSALGLPGTVSIIAPITDPNASLVKLPTATVDASALLRESCATRYAGARGSSSLVDVGRGGLAASPERLTASRYFAPAAPQLAPGPAPAGPPHVAAAERARLGGCAG